MLSQFLIHCSAVSKYMSVRLCVYVEVCVCMCMCICVWGKRRIKLCQNSDLKENKQSGNLINSRTKTDFWWNQKSS